MPITNHTTDVNYTAAVYDALRILFFVKEIEREHVASVFWPAEVSEVDSKYVSTFSTFRFIMSPFQVFACCAYEMSAKDRFQYWFDNQMSKGTIALIRLLAIVTVVAIAVITLAL